MFCRQASLFAALFLCAAAQGTPIDTAAELADALKNSPTAGQDFDITAIVTYVSTSCADETIEISIEDRSGAVLLGAKDRSCLAAFPRLNVVARCRGVTERNAYGRNFAVLTNYEERSAGRVPELVELTHDDLFDGRFDFRCCRFSGILRDVVDTETDPNGLMFAICGRGGDMLATIPCASAQDKAWLESLIGSSISVTGICVPYDRSPRIRTGRLFKVSSLDSIRVTCEADERIPLPAVESIRLTQPSDVAALGRHRAVGWIVAAWHANRALLRTAGGDFVGLEFADGTPLPACGSFVEAEGLPESDLFRINLVSASWLVMRGGKCPDEPVRDISPTALMQGATGKQRVNCEHHGHAVRMTGIVRTTPGGSESPRVYIEGESVLVPVDAAANSTALDALEVGCRVAVTGICILNVDTPRQNATIPRLRGYSIVVRSPADVTVLSRPPWWTPGRLLALVGILLTTLFGILVWNTMLRRLVERRSRQLTRETVAHMSSELKVYERTRLAVELHDSIAQNLTGVSLEIDTAKHLSGNDPVGMNEHLDTAARALKSCRNELRNCLWDLRNQTLESSDMESAIRQTLAPHIGHAELAVRFRVPRERISDNTAHAILRIVRELTVNAIRHGRATSVKVAGSIEDDKLAFSVRDNGCGFDPDNCPNDEQGHYGLLGIRERVNSFEGRLTIASAPGKGTKATIWINIPHETKSEPT